MNCFTPNGMRDEAEAIRRAIYDKLDNLGRNERDVHDAMLDAPVEEAPIYFRAMHRLRAERTRFLRMLSRPSTADMEALGLTAHPNTNPTQGETS